MSFNAVMYFFVGLRPRQGLNYATNFPSYSLGGHTQKKKNGRGQKKIEIKMKMVGSFGC